MHCVLLFSRCVEKHLGQKRGLNKFRIQFGLMTANILTAQLIDLDVDLELDDECERTKSKK